eukprot:11710237-Prorocentrum_lima.AAC.1
MDTRDRWLGIRQLKLAYAPLPYSRRTGDGMHIGPTAVVNQAARYLAEQQWAASSLPGLDPEGPPI